MKITIYIIPQAAPIKPITLSLEINGNPILRKTLETEKLQPVTIFWPGKKNDVIKLFISCEGISKLKPFLHTKRMNFS